ncbi:hypothetical protein CONCODRAFT_167267 [Conidiobolus coronatus NRRL 28638]|uniref:F-box domain-containing protein n=1 Tax=Conidiobolus coronatus (strain ATCC 28846 / CBS 209.66 / NRRL 28638) TaxID=796925 RepID=A0A137PEE9_CONC2|nr:hypothetical protein CONCODRAFT_167267 [Conidiobolus coronatus NRRL 28638]|eukprot:KXN73379.1 hypothetical protein CONCODRAFT_167267 [Conidiobolus coronatus NRRL 28638]
MVVNNLKIDWKSLLLKKEILKYLSEKDLKEVVLCSKDVFKELKPLLLRKFYFNKNTIDFLSELPHINLQGSGNNLKLVTCVYITYKISALEFQVLFTYFNSLKLLHLSSLQFDLTFINSIFKNLTELRCLELIGIKIGVKSSNYENGGDCTLKVPLALSKLTLRSCKAFYQNSNDLNISKEGVLTNSDHCPFYGISKLKFEKLASLTIIKTGGSDDTQFINEFLANNQKLKKLSISYDELNKEAFKLISKSKTLENLSLYKFLGTFKFSTDAHIRSIRYLTLDESIYRCGRVFIYDLVKCFSNVQHLKLIYISKYHLTIRTLVSRLHKLTSLVLISKTPQKEFSLELKNPKLFKINLVNFMLNGVKLSVFNKEKQLKNLRIVKLSNHKSYFNINYDQIMEDNMVQGWDTVFIGTSAICSKYLPYAD